MKKHTSLDIKALYSADIKLATLYREVTNSPNTYPINNNNQKKRDFSLESRIEILKSKTTAENAAMVLSTCPRKDSMLPTASDKN